MINTCFIQHVMLLLTEERGWQLFGPMQTIARLETGIDTSVCQMRSVNFAVDNTEQ